MEQCEHDWMPTEKVEYVQCKLCGALMLAIHAVANIQQQRAALRAEVERLTNLLHTERDTSTAMMTQLADAREENERLRKALEKLLLSADVRGEGIDKDTLLAAVEDARKALADAKGA